MDEDDFPPVTGRKMDLRLFATELADEAMQLAGGDVIEESTVSRASDRVYVRRTLQLANARGHRVLAWLLRRFLRTL